jgi:hypothetical protein
MVRRIRFQPSLARQTKAATPEPNWAKAGWRRELRLGTLASGGV